MAVKGSTFSAGLGTAISRYPGESGSLTLEASAAHTTNAASASVEVIPGVYTLHLNVTASSVPTTLDVEIDTSDDNTNFAKTGAFTQVGAVGTADRYMTVALSRYVKFTPTVVGTSYTYSITGVGYSVR